MLALREHAGVAVVAAQDEQRLLRVRPMNFPGDTLKRVVQAFLLVDVRLQAIVGEAAFESILMFCVAKDDGAFDTEGTMQLAHVAVC